MNLKFQTKIIKKKTKVAGEIAHNLLSIAFLNKEELREFFSDEEIKVLANAIAYHHERGDYEAENYKEELELLKKEIKGFYYSKIKSLKVKKLSATFFNNERIYEDNLNFYDYVKIKGLLNRLDYAASAGIDIEIKNNFLIKALNNLNYQWNELQLFMEENRDNNLVVIAQTGMGKTEAGLLWIGDNKGFFTLPLKTAINEIYKRVNEKIVNDSQKVGLLHSETVSRYIEINESNKKNNEEEFNVDEYYTKTKQLSLPLTICTLDQLFDIVFRYRGFEGKLVTLGYSKIVIDEIQMYSPDLLALLIIGLAYITKTGGKFAILTATLPDIVIDYLRKENIKFITSHKPFINDHQVRHSIKMIDEQINKDFIENIYANNKVLVICNTIKKAKEIYRQLKESKQLNCNINLIHSKFTGADRRNKESAIVEFGNLKNTDSGIWVATQIVEASLDIDFDILVTELSDINGLMQRMGRCYRKRLFKQIGYNCYVFNGGIKTCSGVGTVIDKEIFQYSKEALKNVDGVLKESVKLNLIKEVYSTSKLVNTEYKKQLDLNIDYIKAIFEYEKDKKEIDFRNIQSKSILPKCIYEKQQEVIDNLIKKYQTDHITKLDKQKVLIKIQDYLINVPLYEIKKKIPVSVELSRHNKIFIYDGFAYDSEIGLELLKEDVSQKATVADFDNCI